MEKRPVGILATTLVGSLLLTGCKDAPLPEPYAAPYDICAVDANPKPALYPGDCDKLALLATTEKPIAGATPDRVGAVVLRNGTVDVHIPPALSSYREGLALAASDPLVRYVMGTEGAKIGINVTPNKELANYNTGTRTINLTFSTSKYPDVHTVFTTRGSMRAVSIHEGTHGLVARWSRLAEHNGQTAQLLDAYTVLCAANIQYEMEQFRNTYKDEITAELEKLRNNQNTDPAVAEGAETLIRQFTIPNGLDQLALNQKALHSQQPGLTDCESQDSLQMLQTVVKANGQASAVQNSPAPGRIDDLLSPFLERHFGATDESTTLHGLLGSGGHPYANRTEDIASKMASVQLNPYGVIERISNLPSVRRDNEIQQLGILERLISLNDPSLLAKTNLSLVISALQARKTCEQLMPVQECR